MTASLLKDAPPGNLSLERRGNGSYCFANEYNDGARQRKYIGTPESPAVQPFLDARFQKERIKRLETDRKLLSNLEKRYQNYDPLAVFSSLPGTYREIAKSADAKAGLPKVPPILTGDSGLARRYRELQEWAGSDYERNKAPFSPAATYARDGTRVRSKGECIHYNLQQEFGILFWYDCVLTITDREGRTKKVSPDFLIQCFDGTFVIIEHLGWLTDKGYAIDFGEKCYWYLQKGFIPGTNFFVTSDDIDGGTDSRQILRVVKQVERLFYGF